MRTTNCILLLYEREVAAVKAALVVRLDSPRGNGEMNFDALPEALATLGAMGAPPTALLGPGPAGSLPVFLRHVRRW